MKMISTWFRSARGMAIGSVVGALTVGKATPYLLKGLGGARVGAVVLGASAAGVVAGLLVLAAYRDGPYAFPRRAFSWGLVGRILRRAKNGRLEPALSDWLARHNAQIVRMKQTFEEMQGTGPMDFATLSIALKELSRLSGATKLG